MNKLPLLRFIPFRRSDTVRMCLADGRLDDEQKEHLQQAQNVIDRYFQREFHSISQRLKDAYSPLDPHADTRLVQEFIEPEASTGLASLLEKVLEGANYERLSEQTLQRAFASASVCG